MDPTLHRLRTTLNLNAATSGATGLVCLLFATDVAELIGTEAPGFLQILGIGLMLFALDSAVAARLRPAVLAPVARALGVADLGWTVAMVAVVAAGLVDAVGAGLALGTGVVTAGLGWAELTAGRRLDVELGRASEEAVGVAS